MTLLQLWPLLVVAVICLAILVKGLWASSKRFQAQQTFDLTAWKREQLTDWTRRHTEMRDCVAEIRANAILEASNLERMRARLASVEEQQLQLTQRIGINAEIRQALTGEIERLKLDIEKRLPIVAAAELLSALATAELRRSADGVERLSKELDEEAAHVRREALAQRLAALA